MPPTAGTTVLDPKTGSLGGIVGSIARKDHEVADLELFAPYRAPDRRKCNRIAEPSGRTRPADTDRNELTNVPQFIGPPFKQTRIGPAPANRLPNLAVSTLWFTVEDLIDAQAVTNALEHAQGVEEIRLPAGVRADKEIQRSEVQFNALETLEPFDCQVIDQYYRRRVSSSNEVLYLWYGTPESDGNGSRAQPRDWARPGLAVSLRVTRLPNSTMASESRLCGRTSLKWAHIAYIACDADMNAIIK